ncbi:MAG TPA: hypothetical protein VES20_02225 [Bryobacteraceae bacterium]|nr:hypothetical protein [Bryobacteraceae bacterium]
MCVAAGEDWGVQLIRVAAGARAAVTQSALVRKERFGSAALRSREPIINYMHLPRGRVGGVRIPDGLVMCVTPSVHDAEVSRAYSGATPG